MSQRDADTFEVILTAPEELEELLALIEGQLLEVVWVLVNVRPRSDVPIASAA